MNKLYVRKEINNGIEVWHETTIAEIEKSLKHGAGDILIDVQRDDQSDARFKLLMAGLSLALIVAIVVEVML